MDEGREQAHDTSCGKSRAAPWPQESNIPSKVGIHRQTRNPWLPFPVVAVIGNHHSHCSHENWRCPSCRGCHIIVRLYLPSVCFPRIVLWKGTPRDREEIPALSKGTAWRETHSHEIQLMLNGCTVQLLKKSQRPRHKQLAMSCTLAQEAQSLPQGTCSDTAVLQQSPVVKACLSLRRNDRTPLCNSGFLFCLLPLLPICFHGSNMEKLGFVM